MRRLVALAFAASLALTATAPAYAQKKDAVTHFENGRKLREANDIAGAIEEFKASLASEKTVGAWYNLGACYEKQGSYRKALDAYHEASVLARSHSDPREKDADEATKEIRNTRSWIMLRLKPEVVELEGLKVTIDDVDVPKEEFNGEVFRDSRAGHTVVVAAKDRDTFTAPPAKDHGTIEIQLANLRAKEGTSVVPPGGSGPEITTSGGFGWPHAVGLGAVVVGAAIGGYAIYRVGVVLQDRRDEVASDFDVASKACVKNQPCPVADDRAKVFEEYKSTQQSEGALLGITAGVLLIGGVVLIVTGSSILQSTRKSGANDRTFLVVPQIGVGGGGGGGGGSTGLTAVGTF